MNVSRPERSPSLSLRLCRLAFLLSLVPQAGLLLLISYPHFHSLQHSFHTTLAAVLAGSGLYKPFTDPTLRRWSTCRCCLVERSSVRKTERDLPYSTHREPRQDELAKASQVERQGGIRGRGEGWRD
jgi:hypothetical protein